MPLSVEYRKELWLPLVLRIALAAIFIFHGVDKIATKGNEWGSFWATKTWERQYAPPEGVDEKLANLKPDKDLSEEQIKIATEKLRAAYQTVERDPPPAVAFVGTQMAVAWGELVCGIALLLGLFTRLSSVLMVLVQLGAIFTVTWAHGFAPPSGVGFEYNLLVIAACLALILRGGGYASLDRYIHEWRTGQPGVQSPPQAPVTASG